MNKILLLFLVIFTYVHAEESTELSSSEEQGVRELATLLDTKFNTTIITDIIELVNKTKIQCPGIDEKLDTTVDEVAQCLDDIELGEDTFCTVVSNNLEKCFQPVKKLLVECLPTESKELPIMGIKIFKAIFDQACNSTVEQILELFNPCRLKKDFESFDSCKKVANVFTQNRNKLPSKALVCSFLPNVKACEESHNAASCKNPVTKAALVNFHEAIEGATASECQYADKVNKINYITDNALA